MKIICLLFSPLLLWTNVNLDMINNCAFSSLESSHSNLSRKQFEKLINTTTLKHLFSDSFFPKSYKNDKNIDASSVFQKEAPAAYCPLTSYVYNGLKRDYLNDRTLFRKHQAHIESWIKFFGSKKSDTFLKGSYQKILDSISMKLQLMKSKVSMKVMGPSPTLIPQDTSYITQENIESSHSIQDLNSELDQIFKTID